jgi:hypothetical protein
MGYTCGIGNTSYNGSLSSPYYSNGICGYPAHKNDGPYVSGFYSSFNYLTDCNV